MSMENNGEITNNPYHIPAPRMDIHGEITNIYHYIPVYTPLSTKTSENLISDTVQQEN